MALTKVTKELLDGDLAISGGTVDNSVIGGSTAAAGSFTTLSASSNLDIEGNADINGTTNLDEVDIDGSVQIDATVTIGVDDTGYDVKFFGDTASAYMLWDTSADDLILAGAAGLDVDGATNLDNVDIDGTVQIDGATTFGVDDTGVDVKFFGATSGAYLLWDESADKLLTAGGAVVDIVKDKLLIGGTAVTTTAAELNKLAGAGTLKQAGKETIWIPAAAMYPTTTNGCSDLEQVETTAQRPELKCLDFDASSAEYAQFSVAFPKSWNLGTITFQAFWSPSNTNTGNAIVGLQGLACSEGDLADTAFGTAVEVTDAGIGTVEDVQMTAESGAVTIAAVGGGSPADDDICFFQFYRDAADGSDTFTGDLRLLGIKLFFTTDAANDA